MITLSFRFLSGRFHATPWGHHVNEGYPEWPPSPWRVLRSMIAVWQGKCHGQISTDTARRILGQLSNPPEIALPPATSSHTRHYMPWFKKGPGDKTLVFDTFVVVPSDKEVLMIWPEAHLDAADTELLEEWLLHLGYLGRSESWCDARLVPDAEVETLLLKVNTRPLGTRVLEDGMEIVRVLCADPATAFENTYTPKTEATTGRGRGRQTTIAPDYDPDWHLCGETLWLHEEKWSDPPGSRWVRYSRPADCFKPAQVRKVRNSMLAKPQVARFALDSTLLPLATHALPTAECARRILMGTYGRITGTRANSEVFSGKSSEGQVKIGHGHAYYLPTDEDGDGRLDHLTIFAADGFDPDEIKALDRMRELKSRERDASGHPLRSLMIGLSRLGDDPLPKGNPLGPAKQWRSATPFLAQRHLKTRGAQRSPAEWLASPEIFLRAMLREELQRLIQRHSELEGVDIESIQIESEVEGGAFRIGPQRRRPLEFKRFRRKHGDDGGRRLGGSFRITFPRIVKGPIALGHSSHFGLGLFVPAD